MSYVVLSFSMCVSTSKMTENIYMYIRRRAMENIRVWFITAITEQFSILTIEKHPVGTLPFCPCTEFFQKRTEKEY